jgi:hypothetical protein
MPQAALLLAATLAASAPCDRYGPATRAGSVPAVLSELSGLAASRRHPGVFWAHNDSGNAAVLHALREDGTVVASFPLAGITARDPEDVAVGPCGPATPASCVYLADTGDNLSRRPGARILRVREPERLTGRPLPADVLAFTYADGPRNAEALVAEPRTGRLFVVTKAFTSLGEVFRLDDLAPGRPGRAVRIGAIAAPGSFDAAVTAADAHPSGERVLLLTYGRAYELRRPGARRLDDVFGTTPAAVPRAALPQAEAAAYRADGHGYLLGGEGSGTPLVRVECLPGDRASPTLGDADSLGRPRVRAMRHPHRRRCAELPDRARLRQPDLAVPDNRSGHGQAIHTFRHLDPRPPAERVGPTPPCT